MSDYRTWTDEDREKIKRLRAEGLSVVEIGVRMRAGKNQISSQLGRMLARGEIAAMVNPTKELYGPPTLKVWRKRLVRAMQRGDKPARKPPAPRVYVPRPEIVYVAAPVAPLASVPRVINLGWCQFIKSAERPWIFCDSPPEVGVYCREHHRVCHTKIDMNVDLTPRVRVRPMGGMAR